MAGTAIRERPGQEAFRFVLRSATRLEHQALDAHPAFARLMDGTLSASGYRSLMAAFHGFYRRHDPMLDLACQRLGLDRTGFSYAPRSGILGRDLAALGAAAPNADATEPEPLAGIESAGALGGVLYVIEGSMLGGGVLCRAVEALRPGSGTAGSGYWHWCREAGSARWAMTCAMIETLSAGETARAEMIAGARAGFATFAQWLAGWRDDPLTHDLAPRDVARC